MLITCGR